MPLPFDYDERDRARREDREFFERWPDREYRLRRAWPCECSGTRPAGFEAFVTLHRQSIDQSWDHKTFGAPVTFETNRTDADIREVLLALAQNPRAMLRA
jgi:hypothetical protein